MICSFFVASWTGVVRYHGPRPSMRLKQVFVANHTSIVDRSCEVPWSTSQHATETGFRCESHFDRGPEL
ncbi:hypothetical protein LINPERHAP1_LOCUS27104 [Linum perenne]